VSRHGPFRLVNGSADPILLSADTGSPSDLHECLSA